MKLLSSLFILFFLLCFNVHSTEKEIKNVLITGGTRGLGLETAKVFAEKGYSVWAVGRSVNDVMRAEYPSIHFMYMDVTDSESMDEVLHEIYRQEGHLDVLINNAGYGLLGAVEAVSMEQAKRQFEVNFFGALELTKKVLPSMRKEGKGHIINISSTSGIRALPGLGLYAASKFALEAISEAMAVSLSPFNIKVSVIEPGTVANGWAGSCEIAENEHGVDFYNQLAERFLAKLQDLSSTCGQDQREIALLTYSVASCSDPHLRYQTSKAVEKTVSHKLKDLTGDDLVNMQKQFISSILE